MKFAGSWIMALCLGLGPVGAHELGITSDGAFFTIDGEPAFLSGISYYAGTSVDSPGALIGDLDQMKGYGLNWIRVWTFWSVQGTNYGVTTEEGVVREPYMTRLKTIITECDRRGMIVDVTMHRGKSGPPSNQAQHLKCARTLARELLLYRNVYIDIANECDVGDARHVGHVEVGELIAAIKKIDPDRLCTASAAPGSQKDLDKYLTIGKCDFICPHLRRDARAAAETFATVGKFIKWMDKLGKRVPIHLQEPFRRDYSRGWQPVQEDYFQDATGGKSAGAAGWCLHNGSNNFSDNERPFRSFLMTRTEGRLFSQWDAVEKEVAREVGGRIGGTGVHQDRSDE